MQEPSSKFISQSVALVVFTFVLLISFYDAVVILTGVSIFKLLFKG